MGLSPGHVDAARQRRARVRPCSDAARGTDGTLDGTLRSADTIHDDVAHADQQSCNSKKAEHGLASCSTFPAPGPSAPATSRFLPTTRPANLTTDAGQNLVANAGCQPGERYVFPGTAQGKRRQARFRVAGLHPLGRELPRWRTNRISEVHRIPSSSDQYLLVASPDQPFLVAPKTR